MRLRAASQNQQQQEQRKKSNERPETPLIKIKHESIDTESNSADASTGVCYCNGSRRLGDLEVQCAECKCWFHQACFKDLENFGGLPFMVSYVFVCRGCSPENKEKWHIRSTSYASMAVMTLANMTLEYRMKQGDPVVASDTSSASGQNPFFTIDHEIVHYMEKNWEYLSTTPKRQKKTWHQTILKILQKETELFEQTEGLAFALKERNLFRIGPMHESIVQLFKRGRDGVEREANALQISSEQQISGGLENEQSNAGPKTRGASKRKAIAGTSFSTSNSSTPCYDGVQKQNGSGNGGSQKKAKTTSEFAAVTLSGQPGVTIDFPFNREGYRYYLVERDPNIQNRDSFDAEVSNTRAVQIPSHIHRLVIPPIVTVSPNDRASQLLLEADNVTLTGNEGYSVARATHSVFNGKWFYEMEFLSQPGDSHVRVGWAQSFSALQACVGYSKFSYSWRSKQGTVFHDGYGRSYLRRGFKQGDVIGCLIDLPPLDLLQKSGAGEQPALLSELLPPSRKDCDLIKFKQNYFFEEKEDAQQALQKLKTIPDSRIEFFLNGQRCGVAFRDIYAGHYYPAVSLFHCARVRLNFGPTFHCAPACVRNRDAKPLSHRPEEMYVEQALSDSIYMVVNEKELEKRNSEFFEAVSTTEHKSQQQTK